MRSRHHEDVFSHLPVLLMRAMQTAEVAGLLDALVAAGWRPGQLRHRVGAAPAQGSVEADAAALVVLLQLLSLQDCPDLLHVRELKRRALPEPGQEPADPQTRAHYLAQIRATLPSAPAGPRRAAAQPRLRPACSLCGAESSYFVTAEVHLCRRCVTVLATGQARLSDVG